MKYNDINKTKQDISNEFNKYFDKKINVITNLPYHETFFEHLNTKSHPYRRTGVCAIFENVKLANTDLSKEEIAKLLDISIEHYLQFAPLKKVNVSDFIKYVDEKFHVKIFSIDSIELKQTLSLERSTEKEPEPPKEPDNFNELKILIENPPIKKKKEPIIEMPIREYVEVPGNTVVEMPHRPVKEMPTKPIVEMPNRKPEETRPHEHIPEYELGM